MFSMHRLLRCHSPLPNSYSISIVGRWRISKNIGLDLCFMRSRMNHVSRDATMIILLRYET